MNQIGTLGTKLLKSSRARRKVPLGNVMRLVPEAVRAAQYDKLSLFVTIPGAGGPVLKSLVPGWVPTLGSQFAVNADKLTEAEKVLRLGSERGGPDRKRRTGRPRSGQTAPRPTHTNLVEVLPSPVYDAIA